MTENTPRGKNIPPVCVKKVLIPKNLIVSSKVNNTMKWFELTSPLMVGENNDLMRLKLLIQVLIIYIWTNMSYYGIYILIEDYL